MRFARTRFAAVRARRDDGQLLLLILAYTVIAALLVTVVVNVSKAYLYRRSLLAAADGAALAAANDPDLDRIYTDPGESLPLTEEGALEAVRQYVQDADLEERFSGFAIGDVSTDGVTVTVTLRGSVQMPLLNLISGSYADGYEIDATASATSPLTP